MFYIINDDVLGIIGMLGVMFGVNGVNIVNFIFGCVDCGGEVIVLLYVDDVLSNDVFIVLCDIGKFKQVKLLMFDVV